MNLKDCHNFSDFRKLAKKKLPSPIFHYIDGCSDDEVTLKYFQSSGNQIKLIPANDDFDEIYINKETEGFFIEGKSVGLIRENQ